MQTPDIAELLHDIRSVQYFPHFFLWFSNWAFPLTIFFSAVGLGLLFLVIIVGKSYFKGSHIALRGIGKIQKKYQRGYLPPQQALDQLAGTLRNYFLQEFGIEPASRTEEGLLRALHALSLTEASMKQTIFVLDSLKKARFSKQKLSARRIESLFERAHGVVKLMQRPDQWTQSKK